MSAGSLPQAVGAITVGAGARPVTQCSGNLRMSHWDGGQARRGGMRRWVRAERHSCGGFSGFVCSGSKDGR